MVAQRLAEQTTRRYRTDASTPCPPRVHRRESDTHVDPCLLMRIPTMNWEPWRPASANPRHRRAATGGDEGGEIGGEEQDGTGHVFGQAPAAQGGPLDDGTYFLLRCPRGRCPRKAGGDDIDADPARTDVLRKHRGEVNQAGLGCPVGSMPGGRPVPPARPDEDDATAGREGAITAQQGSGEEEGGVQVDCEFAAPLVRADVRHPPAAGRSVRGVVDDDVEGAAEVRERRRARLHCHRVAHVYAVDLCPAAREARISSRARDAAASSLR